MSLILILISSLILFMLAYKFYGAFLRKSFHCRDDNQLPSEKMNDGIDFVPTHPFVVFGHHFSSIAGAGPIVGPILAALYFGWLPALLWIVLGSIFIGGVHDFGSLMASLRHRAKNIADVARDYMGSFAGKLFLFFIYLALLYVVIVFLDLTALTFSEEGHVATSSILFIFLAIFLGLATRWTQLSMLKLSLIFVPLLYLCVVAGEYFPLNESLKLFGQEKFFWSALLLVYCFVASITPMNFLLQPRDFLSSFLLYGAILGAFFGILFGIFSSTSTDYNMSWPAFISASELRQIDVQPLGYLFPILFITVACGACSGFHSLVSAGTTARQIKTEKDALRVGYGAMLVEGLVAVVALTTVLVLSFEKQSFGSPLNVFSKGVGGFMQSLGLPIESGRHFAYLAISTFLLTTLDTCTRLSRYVLQSIFSWSNDRLQNRIKATLLAVAIPACFAFLNLKDNAGNVIPLWRAIWPIFGASNQLLAALALLAVTIWLKRSGKKYLFAFLPMIGMLAATLSALMLMVYEQGLKSLLGLISTALLIMGLVIVFESVKAFRLAPINHEEI
jgi:carbon starvation protein